MKKVLLILAALCCLTASARKRKVVEIEEPQKVALEKVYRYRLTLSDKDHNTYSLERPEEFLSGKSLERRQRMGLQVDEHDLPISPVYLEGIRATGARVFNCSKWNNTVQVELRDTTLLSRLRALPFVTGDLRVYAAPDSMEVPEAVDRFSLVGNETTYDSTDNPTDLDSYYGPAWNQVKMLNLQQLHAKGLHGEGMTIGVLDGGFYNADIIPALKDVNILGIRNFARPESSIYEEHPHGMMVLSCMAPHQEGVLVGTSPAASFYLLQSEDTWFEYQGEEDNWCAALEYADSLGVDVVTSSLGYTHFDTPKVVMEYAWLDGRHELNSRSASLAASRGILLLNSAGNEGDETWKKIGFPADATDIITVGACTKDSVNTNFSSLGYAADHRIKPDAMAQGGRTFLLGKDGNVTTANGTSFSCPILAGAVTCLVQAFPNKRPEEIIEALQQSGHYAHHPNEVYGYGIPDLLKAYNILQGNVTP